MRPNLDVLRTMTAPLLTELGMVLRDTRETTQDPDTGSETPVLTTVYEGPLLVRPQYAEHTEEAGGTTYVASRYDLAFPVDTPVQRGDVVQVTAAPYDAALLDVDFTVLDVPLDAWQALRYAVGERLT